MSEKIKIFLRILFFPVYLLILFLTILKIKFLSKNNLKINEISYQALIKSFCITGGWSNSLVSFFLKKKILSDLKFDNENEVLKNNKFNRITLQKKLNEDGFIILNNFLTPEDCIEIENFSFNELGYYQNRLNFEKVKFNPSKPEGIVYRFEEQVILKNSIMKKIAMNSLLASIAQDYFKSLPFLTGVNLWWSTAYNKIADKDSAQYFHFDMDSPKWLKFFFYITDVSESNGPHVFVKKTHKNNGIPWEIRKLGYQRVNDNEVFKFYDKKDILEFIGNRGTLIIEDTRGLHKGKVVESKSRLIFEIEYSNTIFVKKEKNSLLKNESSSSVHYFYKL
jgi:hypothetical protein